MQPFYIVFAGVNGSGKSTLFRSGLWRTDGIPLSMPRVNPDEMLRDGKGDWKSISDQVEAGKLALRAIDGHFEHRRSFNHETTLTGHRALKNIRKARELGYRVRLYYVGVDNEHIAIERIRHRVACGGHDIDADTVRKRYRASLTNFSKALEYCEEAYVFDNTVAFSCIAVWSGGALSWWGVSRTKGSWLVDAMLDDDIWEHA